MAWGLRKGRGLFVVVVAVATAPSAASSAETLFDNGYSDLSLRGLLDLRAVHSADDRSTYDGGLGKLAYGSNAAGGGRWQAQFGGLFLDATADISPELEVVADIQAVPRQEVAVDIQEAYARWHPAPTGDVGWQVKLGAFFPPISLENDGLAWTSRYSVTPSAINSWVGQELRTEGGEVTATWRHVALLDDGRFDLFGAVFGGGDGTGEILDYRGWNFDDRVAGLIGRVRLPDEVAKHQGRSAPVYFQPFAQIGDTVGYYTGARASSPSLGTLSYLYWDNRADPTQFGGSGYAWNTFFHSVGYKLEPAPGWTVLGQGMWGQTTVTPTPASESEGYFEAAYLLVSREWSVPGFTDRPGLLRATLRFDAFSSHEDTAVTARPHFDEHGKGYLGSLSYRPLRWLRWTVEYLRVDSRRQQRLNVGLPPDESEHQVTLDARVSF